MYSKLFWVSAVLICAVLIELVVGGIQWVGEPLSPLVPAVRHGLSQPVPCENFSHIEGLGRITLGVLGLLILFIPYRKREPWAWLALATVPAVCGLPVFTHFPPTWAAILAGVRGPGLGRATLEFYLFPMLIALGLLLSLPSFIRPRPAASPDAH